MSRSPADVRSANELICSEAATSRTRGVKPCRPDLAASLSSPAATLSELAGNSETAAVRSQGDLLRGV